MLTMSNLIRRWLLAWRERKLGPFSERELAARVLSWFVTAGVVSHDGYPHPGDDSHRTKTIEKLSAAFSALREGRPHRFKRCTVTLNDVRRLLSRENYAVDADGGLCLTERGVCAAVPCYDKFCCGWDVDLEILEPRPVGRG